MPPLNGADAAAQPQPAIWDLYCRVIDNHGDIGVCWRLAQALARRGQRVRLIIDDASALAWMAPPDALPVQVLPWNDQAPGGPSAAVVVEAFGCQPPDGALARMAAAARVGQAPVWINLEYLSAEGYVERAHRLPSPQFSGLAAGLTKWFFYPGFTPATGGLLHADAPDAARLHDTRNWLAAQGLAPAPGERAVLVFGYANPRLPALLQGLADQPTRLWLAPGPLQQPLLQHRWPPGLRAQPLPAVPQPRFDALLALTDLNLVRGEDSFVRAQVLAEAPHLWHIYPQHDGAHAAKLQAFADRLLHGAPPSMAQGWRQALLDLNGLAPAGAPARPLRWAELATWADWQRGWRRQLRAQADLADALLAFAAQATPGHRTDTSGNP